VVEGGRVVQQGTPAEVASRPATDYVARLVGLNLYEGRIDGERVVLPGGGWFVVPDHGQHGGVLVAVRPSSVLVSTHRPEGASARNVWAGTVVGLSLLTDRVRLEVDGTPPALVDVTPGSVVELALAPGREIWLSVKATELDVYGRQGT
jgi:molybdate transport system ATP-binding protein